MNSEYVEIQEPAHLRLRCFMPNGKPTSIVPPAFWGRWNVATHELVVYRHKVTNDTVIFVRKLPERKSHSVPATVCRSCQIPRKP